MTQDGFAGLRVGHAERDAVAAVLQEAAGDGRLAMDELDERLEAALQAKTYAELEPLVADLSADLPWRPRGPGAVVAPGGSHPSAYPSAPGWSREDPLRLDGGVSTEKRDGVWVVPPFLRISSGAGTVKLNCLQATAGAAVIDIEVVAGAGSVTVIVPDGWAVNDDRLGKGMGSKTIKVAREPAPGHPLLLLWGGVGLGSLKVRPPTRRELRRLEAPR